MRGRVLSSPPSKLAKVSIQCFRLLMIWSFCHRWPTLTSTTCTGRKFSKSKHASCFSVEVALPAAMVRRYLPEWPIENAICRYSYKSSCRPRYNRHQPSVLVNQCTPHPCVRPTGTISAFAALTNRSCISGDRNIPPVLSHSSTSPSLMINLQPGV